MARVSTVSRLFSKKDLHRIILEGIRNAGWNFTILNNINSSPLKLLLTHGRQQDEVAIYIWNISHGGKTRSVDEYRIQLKGNGLIVGDTFKTLLLGWYQEEKVFAAFNAFKHRIFGRSPSVQVTKTTLHQAVEHGIAFQTKKTIRGQDIVITFQPDYIIEYIGDLYPQYHKNRIGNISNSEMSVVKNPFDVKIPEDALNRLPKKRRTVVSEINRKIRDAKFQRGIYGLYKGKCAICGLQAHLTEAAHIIPVKEEGSDELINGLLLCRNHHKAFDMGLLNINEKYNIVINEEYAKWLSDTSHDNKLKEFLEKSRIGEKIFLPDDARFYPKKEYLIRSCKLKGI